MRRVLPAPALKLWWIVAVWADALFVVPCSSTSYCTMVAVGPCLEMRVRMCMHDVFVRHGVAWSKEKQKGKPKRATWLTRATRLTRNSKELCARQRVHGGSGKTKRKKNKRTKISRNADKVQWDKKKNQRTLVSACGCKGWLWLWLWLSFAVPVFSIDALLRGGGHFVVDNRLLPSMPLGPSISERLGI